MIKVCMIYIYSMSYMAIQFISYHLTFDETQGQIKVIEF